MLNLMGNETNESWSKSSESCEHSDHNSVLLQQFRIIETNLNSAHLVHWKRIEPAHR